MLKLKPLPFAVDALEPILSAYEVEQHHDFHQKAYVDKANELIKGSSYEGMSLDELVQTLKPGKLFNQVNQIKNHEFYWDSLTPFSEWKPSLQICSLITKQYGSKAKFKKEFIEAGLAEFGSGWMFLVAKGDNKLSLLTFQNAENPFNMPCTPLLGVDVWEHGFLYDPQYAHDRKKYIENVFDLLDWEFADANL